MRAVSLDRLRERVELAQVGYEGALKEFNGALDAARNGGAPKKGKRRGRPKGSKNKSKSVEPVAPVKKSKHPWRAKKILDKPSNPATEATE
jgi:hypothetical protein